MSNSEIMARLLRSSDREEAIAFLERGNGRHNVGEMSYENSLALVRRLYELGAIEVWAVEVGKNAGLASTDTLIVTMPRDSVARWRLFDWNNERVRLMGFDPDIDQGERHMLVWFG
jgi:hypothetical protein